MSRKATLAVSSVQGLFATALMLLILWRDDDWVVVAWPVQVLIIPWLVRTLDETAREWRLAAREWRLAASEEQARRRASNVDRSRRDRD